MSPILKRFKPAQLAPPLPIAGFIALGGGDDRIFEAARLARTHPGAKLVITGHGDRAVQLAQETGMPQNRVIIEPAATSTFENAQLTARMLQDSSLSRWVLVTSDYHMPRAIGAFRKAGLDVLPWPIPDAEGPWDYKLTIAAHEWLGMLAYWLRGRSDAIFPAASDAPHAARIASRTDDGLQAN